MYFGLDNMIFWTWLRSLYQFTCKIYYGICLGGEILLEVETCYLVQVIFHIPSLVSSKDDKPSKPWGGRRQNKWWNHFRYVMESCILIAKTSRRHSQANDHEVFDVHDKLCYDNCIILGTHALIITIIEKET